MGSFSGLGIGLSFLFGCILMGLVAELYYLWWCKNKKRTTFNNNNSRESEESPFFFCWKKPILCTNIQPLNSSVRNPQEEAIVPDLEMGSGKDICFSKGYDHHEQEGIEAELMRIHNLCGPPRFLFTINEESKEDLESEDGRSRSSRKGSRTKSLGDFVFSVDNTPFLTPLASPTMKNLNNHMLLDSYNNHGFSFNPLFESISDAEVNRLRSSPPPKFKFLKDAEDKLIRRLLMEEIERKSSMKNENDCNNSNKDGSNQEEKGVSFVTLSNNKGLVRDQLLHNKHSSQVIPLASSPTSKPVIDTMK